MPRRDVLVDGGELFPRGVIATVDKPKRRRRAATHPAPITTKRTRKPDAAPPADAERKRTQTPAQRVRERDDTLGVDPKFSTDPDAPSATTADGRNPWPAIWAEDLLAGRTDLHPDCAAAGREWLKRNRVESGAVADADGSAEDGGVYDYQELEDIF